MDNHNGGLSFILYKKAFDNEIHIFRKYFRNYCSLNDILNEKYDIKSLIEVQLSI